MDAVPLGIVRFHHLEILGSLISPFLKITSQNSELPQSFQRARDIALSLPEFLLLPKPEALFTVARSG